MIFTKVRENEVTFEELNFCVPVRDRMCWIVGKKKWHNTVITPDIGEIIKHTFDNGFTVTGVVIGYTSLYPQKELAIVVDASSYMPKPVLGNKSIFSIVVGEWTGELLYWGKSDVPVFTPGQGWIGTDLPEYKWLAERLTFLRRRLEPVQKPPIRCFWQIVEALRTLSVNDAEKEIARLLIQEMPKPHELIAGRYGGGIVGMRAFAGVLKNASEYWNNHEPHLEKRLLALLDPDVVERIKYHSYNSGAGQTFEWTQTLFRRAGYSAVAWAEGERDPSCTDPYYEREVIWTKQ